MKTYIKITTTIISLLLTTNFSLAQNRTTEEMISAEMKKVLTTENGIKIRYAPKEKLDLAVKNLGGKVTVDFGKNKELKLSGGVVIGSGSDGLVASNNTDSGAPVVVNPPLVPKMSLTLVGGNQSLNYCVSFIEKNEDGSIAKGKSKGHKHSLENALCNVTGRPIRLKNAGTYYVYINAPESSSSMFVEVADGENKVIPLREVVIPYAESSSDVYFKIYPDFETSKIEWEKKINSDYSLYDLLSSNCHFTGLQPKTCAYLANAKTVDEFRALYGIYSTEDFFYFGVLNFDKTKDNPSPLHSSQAFQLFSPSAYDIIHKKDFRRNEFNKPYTYYVLPGVYGIVWKIDNGVEVTKGIYVQ